MKHRSELKPIVDLFVNNDELCIDVLINGNQYAFDDIPLNNLSLDKLVAKLLSIKENALLAFEARNY